MVAGAASARALTPDLPSRATLRTSLLPYNNVTFTVDRHKEGAYEGSAPSARRNRGAASTSQLPITSSSSVSCASVT